ncbi:hypothetical protein MNBD_GAMMA09-657 [hydrothermal vent metagenome]|uniref:Flagellar protein FliT n=1 Tax=hydrothermal vent metagenome TaxID=652676 RepID=A0A3B0XZ96_9ZZZZ
MNMSMSDNRNQQWQNILQMTKQLSQLSAEENWQQMIELEAERFDRLKQFFSSPVTDAEAGDIAEGIQQIMENDQHLLELGKNIQQQTSESARKISKGRMAVNAYKNLQN